MKRLHIVEPYHSKAMQKMTQPLIDALPAIYEVTTSAEPDLTADLNYHIPWHSLQGLEKGAGKHAMLYTHCNPGAESGLLDACERADLIICMSFTGRHELIELGADPAKMWVIYASGGEIPMRKRNVGVVGYEQPNGRKRSHLLIDLAWNKEIVRNTNFVIVGAGWDDVVGKMKNLGASVDYLPEIPDENMPNLYGALDMLLVTGHVEGGPLTVLEALSAGVPVLAPPVGYASDLLDDECIYTNDGDLVKKLIEFARPFAQRQLTSRMYTWDAYANEHALVFGRLMGESVELDPRAGAARYAQLLDIIRDNKIRFICEIGTWNGANAVRMIQEAQKYNSEIEYAGYDLFESMTATQFKKEFSKWGWPESVVYKRIKATGASVGMNAGDTNEMTEAYDEPGFYFIDGGHSEKTILNDWLMVSGAIIVNNAVVVLDDYYHENKPDGMGCNTLVDSLDATIYNVEHLPVRTTADSGLVIGMVKVTRADISVH